MVSQLYLLFLEARERDGVPAEFIVLGSLERGMVRGKLY
jgi:hypothetical protein